MYGMLHTMLYMFTYIDMHEKYFIYLFHFIHTLIRGGGGLAILDTLTAFIEGWDIHEYEPLD